MMEITKVTKPDMVNEYLTLSKQIDAWASVRAEYANKALTDIQRGHGVHGLLAYDGDQLVGVMSYEIYSDIINLSYLGTARNRVGAAMVDMLKQETQDKTIALIAEAGSDGFWRKQGFKETKKHTYILQEVEA